MPSADGLVTNSSEPPVNANRQGGTLAETLAKQSRPSTFEGSAGYAGAAFEIHGRTTSVDPVPVVTSPVGLDNPASPVNGLFAARLGEWTRLPWAA